MTFDAAFVEWRLDSMLCFTVRRPREFWFLASCTGACFLSDKQWTKTLADCDNRPSNEGMRNALMQLSCIRCRRIRSRDMTAPTK